MNKLYYCVMVSLLVVPEPATFTMCGLLAMFLIQQGCQSALLAVASVGSTPSGEPPGEHALAVVSVRVGGAGIVRPVPSAVKQSLPNHVESDAAVDLRTAGRIRDGERLRFPFAERSVVG